MHGIRIQFVFKHGKVNKWLNMSILKVNVNDIKISIVNNKIFMLGYKETTKTKPPRKTNRNKIFSMVHFVKTVNYKLTQS